MVGEKSLNSGKWEMNLVDICFESNCENSFLKLFHGRVVGDIGIQRVLVFRKPCQFSAAFAVAYVFVWFF